MIDAVIFDMDGVLIDSEPLWREAEMKIFKKVGIELTTEMCMETAGLRIEEVVSYWHRISPWHGPSKQDIIDEIDAEVRRLIMEKGEQLPGVSKAIGFFTGKGIPIGLASSSSPGIIRTVLQKLNLENAFEAVCSAVHEEYGKPHPAVYITAAGKLGCKPEHCLAVEDSFNGLIAAKAARMKTIAVPDPLEAESPKFSIADLKLESLEQLTETRWEELNKPSHRYIAHRK